VLSVHSVPVVLAKFGRLSPFSCVDRLIWNGLGNHTPSIIHLPYGKSVECGLASDNNCRKKVVEPSGKELVGMVAS